MMSMLTYNWSRLVVVSIIEHETISETMDKMKTHFLPKTSERYPTGQIVVAMMTPIKKQAPRNPILDLLSQSISAC